MGKKTLMILAAAMLFCSGSISGCGSLSAGITAGENEAPESDPAGYFGTSDDGSAAVVLDGELQETRGLSRDGAVWLPWEMVWHEIDPAFYFEEEDAALVFTCESGEYSSYFNT